MRRRPQRSTRYYTRFPYTTLFRSSHIEVDELLEQGIVERRDPVVFIGRHAKIDRHGALAKLAKIEVACRCCGIDQWVEPKAEDVGDRLFNVGKTVVRAASEIGERRPATDRQAQSGIGEFLFEKDARIAIGQMAINGTHRPRFAVGFGEPGPND